MKKMLSLVLALLMGVSVYATTIEIINNSSRDVVIKEVLDQKNRKLQRVKPGTHYVIPTVDFQGLAYIALVKNPSAEIMNEVQSFVDAPGYWNDLGLASFRKKAQENNIVITFTDGWFETTYGITYKAPTGKQPLREEFTEEEFVHINPEEGSSSGTSSTPGSTIPAEVYTILRVSKNAQAYEILGVDKDASLEAIRTAYKKKMLQLHPDRHPGEEIKYQGAAQVVGQAYDTMLANWNKREDDRQLAAVLRPNITIYELLSLPQGATQQEKEIAYNQLVRRWRETYNTTQDPQVKDQYYAAGAALVKNIKPQITAA